MDCDYLFHTLIYAIMMPLIFILLCFILPPYFIFKFIGTILRFCSTETMKGKVVLITGASSGIGEQLAYEYAKKGASLVIVANDGPLQKVAEKARRLGSPDVLHLIADVSKVDDCKRFVDEAINHFGRLDHLVNNAGIVRLSPIKDATDVTKFAPVMDVNFWGNVYPTYFAIPYLKKTKGKIVVNSSTDALLHIPRLSFYAASKAALIGFYETLRAELSPSITITILTFGFIKTEMSRGKAMEDVIQGAPMMSSKTCAHAVVDAVCRGERYVTEPKWYRPLVMLKNLCPELIEWYYSTIYLRKKGTSSRTQAN